MDHDERTPLLSQIYQVASEDTLTEKAEEGICEDVGTSSNTQTTINSVNVLIGCGLLAFPLAMRYAGWILGLTLMTISAISVFFAGNLLAECLAADRSLKTYVDVARHTFGVRGQAVTTVLFALNMIATCVAFIDLFGDTTTLLVPSISTVRWKILAGLIALPLHFLSFRILAHISIIGVFSTLSIVGLTVISGLIRTTGPGSLLSPAPTSLVPQSWFSLCVSIGLFMAAWGANGAFPTIFREMKTPQSYVKSVSTAYGITYIIDCLMASCGYLMFGPDTAKTITTSILTLPDGYPRALLLCLTGFTAIMPLTKITLNSKPLVTIIENILFGVDPVDQPSKVPATIGEEIMAEEVIKPLTPVDLPPRKPQRNLIKKAVVRILVIAMYVIISIAVPGFDKVMALLGAALCYAISVVMPIMFHLRMFGKKISRIQKAIECSIIISACILAVIGTWAAILN